MWPSEPESAARVRASALLAAVGAACVGSGVGLGMGDTVGLGVGVRGPGEEPARPR